MKGQFSASGLSPVDSGRPLRAICQVVTMIGSDSRLSYLLVQGKSVDWAEVYTTDIYSPIKMVIRTCLTPQPGPLAVLYL